MPIAKGVLEGATPVTGARPRGAIILVRHGRPALSRKVKLDWRGYVTWWASYGESGLDKAERPPEQLATLARSADLIVSSPLPRARETAMALTGGQAVDSDPLFVEAPLPAPQIPFLKLRPGAWGVVSRICWWLGYAAKGESRWHAKARARLAADRLTEFAANHTMVVLCGHGWFNRMTRKVLRQRGWQCAYDGGDSYWAFRRYEPPQEGNA